MRSALVHKGSITIRGDRIVLQPFKTTDVFFMFKNWANDSDVTRYMTWFPHESIQETESVIAHWINNYSKADFYQWAIFLQEIDEHIQFEKYEDYPQQMLEALLVKSKVLTENQSEDNLRQCIKILELFWRQGLKF